jgi:hypothetical protein
VDYSVTVQLARRFAEERFRRVTINLTLENSELITPVGAL